MVANDPRAHAWFPTERIVADAEPGLGPLAGIATALTAARGAPVIVVAWDMPFVPAALLLALRRRGAQGAGAEAVVPVHGTRPHVEPLCAYYAPVALDLCTTLLSSGERRAGALVEALGGTILVGGSELAAFGLPARLFTSVDSPEQLAALGGSEVGRC